MKILLQYYNVTRYSHWLIYCYYILCIYYIVYFFDFLDFISVILWSCRLSIRRLYFSTRCRLPFRRFVTLLLISFTSMNIYFIAMLMNASSSKHSHWFIIILCIITIYWIFIILSMLSVRKISGIDNFIIINLYRYFVADQVIIIYSIL